MGSELTIEVKSAETDLCTEATGAGPLREEEEGDESITLIKPWS